MSRILVTGAGGMVGHALCAALAVQGHEISRVQSRRDCDLSDPAQVTALFRSVRPNSVFHLAANVFGVGGNMAFPGEVFYRNTMMNTAIIEAARDSGVEKIVAMGSAAMYSDGLTQPMREADVMAGEPHGSEFAYAYSKRAMLAQLLAYEKQYGIPFGFVIATNMYGPHDKFDTENGHVVPSLLKKFIDAERSGDTVEIWGDGTPTRDFLYAGDAAKGLISIMNGDSGAYNLATGLSVTIADLVEAIAAHFPSVRYEWNTAKPLGQLRRAYDTQRLQSIGFQPAYSLADGIAETVSWLRANYHQVRQ